ncbi:NTP transferase domain-containing protein [Desulfurococcaceae archaeon MEX13E-LK6-19]|nr:NTP transferase domain-containing protein [Desulfurococcaceae archaeon MEX13E-LK6-19]
MINEAVVLAAGLSKRFRRDTGVYKVFADLDGFPLIAYPVISLVSSGIERIIVVVNHVYGNKVVNVIEDIVHNKLGLDTDIAYVVNTRPELGNGYSLYLALPLLHTNRFIVSMSDHVYTPSIIDALKKSLSTVLGGDSTPKYIDVNEATRIQVEDECVVRVGKNITPYKYVDIGVHVLEKTLPFNECLKEPYEFSQLLTCFASKRVIRVVDVKGSPWADVDTYDEYIRLTKGSSRIVIEEVKKEWRMRGIRI